MGRMRLSLAFALVLVVGCSTATEPGTSQQEQAAATVGVNPASQPHPTTPPDLAATAAAAAIAAAQAVANTPAIGTEGQTPAAETPATATQPASESSQAAGDITLGKPLVLREVNAAAPTVFVPVTNHGPDARGFTVTATWKTGERAAATAMGTVRDLLPGQMKAVALTTTQAIPDTAMFEVAVDGSSGDTGSTSRAEAAKKITFGEPDVTPPGVAVAVTNGDDKLHSFTVQALFTTGGQLIGVGTGRVDDLGAGATTMAQLRVQGATEGTEVAVVVDTIEE
jgi:hypothetical protein